MTCGIGDQIRVRLCDSPMPADGGHNCTANGSKATQNQSCVKHPCPGEIMELNIENNFQRGQKRKTHHFIITSGW